MNKRYGVTVNNIISAEIGKCNKGLKSCTWNAFLDTISVSRLQGTINQNVEESSGFSTHNIAHASSCTDNSLQL
jgi:hypothetical protein